MNSLGEFIAATDFQCTSHSRRVVITLMEEHERVLQSYSMWESMSTKQCGCLCEARWWRLHATLDVNWGHNYAQHIETHIGSSRHSDATHKELPHRRVFPPQGTSFIHNRLERTTHNFRYTNCEPFLRQHYNCGESVIKPRITILCNYGIKWPGARRLLGVSIKLNSYSTCTLYYSSDQRCRLTSLYHIHSPCTSVCIRWLEVAIGYC